MFHEPVREATFTPGDFVRFVSDFVDAGYRIQTVSFQGYEVTLPESWPYLEPVFRFARKAGIRRTFVTNGMLLGRLASAVDATDPSQITVSLDGGTPPVNDAARGLPGAFEVTLRSVDRLIRTVPRLRPRLAVASCVYDETTFRSLLQLPTQLRSLGVSRWILSLPLSEQDGTIAVPSAHAIAPWLQSLADTAHAQGIQAHFIDLLGIVQNTDALRVVRPASLENVYRLDPSGTIRTGSDLMGVYDRAHAIQWNPQHESAPATCGLSSRRALSAGAR